MSDIFPELETYAITNRRRIWLRRILIGLAAFVVYVVTAVPFGMLIYTIKTESGLNVFTRTGWHAYVQCVQHELATEAGGEKSGHE